MQERTFSAAADSLDLLDGGRGLAVGLGAGGRARRAPLGLRARRGRLRWRLLRNIIHLIHKHSQKTIIITFKLCHKVLYIYLLGYQKNFPVTPLF